MNGRGAMGEPGPELIVIGRLGAPHGLRGELRFLPETDFPERLVQGRRVALRGPGEEELWTTIVRVRPLGGRGLLVALEGIRSREAAEPFAGGTLCVDAVDLPPLPAGRYYHHELVGLRVLRADGRLLGRVVDVRQTGANDVFVVARTDGGEALIPAIRDAVAEIDAAGGCIRLKDMPGLLDP